MNSIINSKSLPVIVSNAPSSSSSRVVLSSDQSTNQFHDSLPTINFHNTRPTQPKIHSRQQPISSEEGVVVGTKQLHSSTPKRPPTEDEWETWNRQQIIESAEEAQKSKLEWENEIARHILSVYASSNVTKNLTESQALLDFVAEKQPRKPLQNDSEIPNHYPTFREEQANPQSIQTTKPFSTLQSVEEEEDQGQQQPQSKSDPEAPTKTKKKKKKKKTPAVTAEPTNGLIDAQFIQDFVAQLERSSFASRGPEQYRVTNTIRARNGQTIVIRGNPRVSPIWFVPSGEVYANWSALPGGRQLQAHVAVLYEQAHYAEYLHLLEQVILTLWRERVFGQEDFVLGSFGKDTALPVSRTGTTVSTPRPRSSTKRRSSTSNTTQQVLPKDWSEAMVQEHVPLQLQQEPWFNTNNNTHNNTNNTLRTSSVPIEQLPTVQDTTIPVLPSLDTLVALWQQLILTCLAIGTLVLEKKQYDKGLAFFNLAEKWACNDDVLTNAVQRKELRGYLKDAMAYYFLKRGKAVAARAYANQALEIFEQVGNLDGIAGCLLHIAAVHCQLAEFKESHCILFQFLAMIEESEGRLAQQISSPKQLCMVAIGYHNLAVIQLKLNMPDLACKSSQNARKLARLCLSYSNRWIDIFQYTHEVALADMKYELTTKTIDQFTPQQQLLIKELATLLFQVEGNNGETL